MERTRVLLAVECRLLREGLRSLLEKAPDLDVFVETAGAASLLSTATRVSPDVVLVDPRAFGASWHRLAQTLLEMEPRPVVIALVENETWSRYWPDEEGVLILRLRGTSSSDLLRAVRTRNHVPSRP